MFTIEELRTITSEEYREAINAVLSKMIVRDGKIDVGVLERSELDHALYLFRYYRAICGGIRIER